MGLAPGVLPGRVGLEEGRDWFTRAWGQVPAERGRDASGIIAAAAEGRVQALVLLGADPVGDFPDRRQAEQALAGAGFVVAVDAFLSESSRLADVVLPAAMYAERPGTTTNLEGRITRVNQKVVPPGVAWPDWMIAVELAARLGTDLELDTLDEIWTEIEALAPSHRGLTDQLLSSARARDGVVAPLGADTEPVPAPIDPMSDPGISAVSVHGAVATAATPLTEHEPAPPRARRPDGPPPALLGVPEPGPAPAPPCGWSPVASSTTRRSGPSAARPWPAWPPRPCCT
jgi:NADH-quinone oxidoreductase subunit G